MLLETAQPIGSTTALGMLGRQTAKDVRPHGRRITPCRARLLDQVRQAIRVRHYSYRSEQQNVAWIRRYIHFHDCRNPRSMGGPEISAFLTHLASDRNVAAAAQNQALAALLFLYKSGIGDRTALARPDRALQAPEARAGRADPC